MEARRVARRLARVRVTPLFLGVRLRVEGVGFGD